MGQKGFTLVELLITVAAMAILVTVASLNFSTMNRKATIEKQMNMIHSDLLEARQKALYEKSSRAVKFTATQFNVYPGSSTSDTPSVTRTLTVPVAWSTAADPLVIIFDTYGVANVSDAAATCVCAEPSADNTATVDSLAISQTKIAIGKRDSGGSCVEASIARK